MVNFLLNYRTFVDFVSIKGYNYNVYLCVENLRQINKKRV